MQGIFNMLVDLALDGQWVSLHNEIVMMGAKGGPSFVYMVFEAELVEVMCQETNGTKSLHLLVRGEEELVIVEVFVIKSTGRIGSKFHTHRLS